MNLLTIEGLTKSYTDKMLFHQISFGVSENDKIGLIGINGTGKSTLLKILAGLEKPDGGIVTTINGLKIGYLPQSPEFEQGTTVINQVFRSESPVMKLVQEYENTLMELNNRPGEPELLKKIAHLSQEMDKSDAWGLESEAKVILTKLGITDFQKDVGFLSGGQKKRVAMASALITPVDLLILDEPTNHIDNETVDWLEKYLSRYTKALFMVTHDRYFLDRVVNRIIELDSGSLYSYQTNYSGFLEKKQEREELLAAGERKRKNFLRTELEWVRRGAQARSTKQKARLMRFEEVSAKKAPSEKENVEINVGSSRLGKKTIELNNIGQSFDGVEYINDFSYIILRDDRIGLIGPNGCGKSTLMKIMTETIHPDKGYVETGETVKIGLFSQENPPIDDTQRVIDYMKETAEYINTADGKITASQMLEKFLFPPDLQYSPVSKLSGGEKRRLFLLKVLMDSPNILFLDEPTNDLDIETLAILEEYLDSFPGAVVAVSHDRYFLDRVAERIFSFEGEGRIKQYEGGYSDYALAKEKENDISEEIDLKKNIQSRVREKDKPLKMSYKEQREFEQIADVISEFEQNILLLEQEISNAGSDYVSLQKLTAQKEEKEVLLEQALERWMFLTELAERIEEFKAAAKPIDK